MKKILILIIWMVGTSKAVADCWLQAEKIFRIESELLYAIALQESSLIISAVGHNRNGSRDLGLMQINSSHLQRLNLLGINEQKLLKDPCISVIVGASILADMMKIYGYSWQAVGAYNAGTSPKKNQARQQYAEKIRKHYQKLKAMPEEEKMAILFKNIKLDLL